MTLKADRVYVGNMVRALSVSLAPPSSAVLEARRRTNARDDRLSRGLHVEMEDVRHVTHVRPRLERT
jgi:hypothetical protein